MDRNEMIEWISVHDSLPEITEDGYSEEILAYGQYRSKERLPFVCVMDEHQNYRTRDGGHGYNVTHWAPKPKEYEND